MLHILIKIFAFVCEKIITTQKLQNCCFRQTACIIYPNFRSTNKNSAWNPSIVEPGKEARRQNWQMTQYFVKSKVNFLQVLYALSRGSHPERFFQNVHKIHMKTLKLETLFNKIEVRSSALLKRDFSKDVLRNLMNIYFAEHLGIIHLVPTQNIFRKTKISCPLICTYMCAYKIRVRSKCSFFGKFCVCTK